MVISQLLECSNVVKRGKLLSFYVELCEQLYDMRSLHALMLVLSGLQSNPVHRLKKSWALAYLSSYTIIKKDAATASVRDSKMSQSSERSSMEGGNNTVSITKTVKDGYAELLAITGIGGRLLSNELAKFLSSSNPNVIIGSSDAHRVSFPDLPTAPTMPFVNSSLGTLIRLNELPDEIGVSQDEALDNCIVSEDYQPPKAEGDAVNGDGGLGNMKIYNLSKMRRVASIIAMLRMCQLIPYDFEPRAEIQYYIQKPNEHLEAEAQYQRSKELEPPGE